MSSRNEKILKNWLGLFSFNVPHSRVEVLPSRMYLHQLRKFQKDKEDAEKALKDEEER